MKTKTIQTDAISQLIAAKLQIISQGHSFRYNGNEYFKLLPDDKTHIRMKDNLNIIIKRSFFDQIKAGKKTIEYRDLKPFWAARLCKKWHIKGGHLYYDGFIIYKTITFINGYNTNAEKLRCKYKCTKVNSKIGLFEIGFIL